jgi:molecular chaperone GrpE
MLSHVGKPQYDDLGFSVGEGEEGAIIEVYQKGYSLGPRVLRHSKVKVGKYMENGE